MLRLKQRADFLAAAGGAKVATAGFVLQGRNRDDGAPARIGFTVSRKVGTAVERNRVRRRLRDIVRRSPADDLRSGYDYVLIGRRTALSRQFRNARRRLDRQRSTPPGNRPDGGRKTGR